MPRPNPPPTPGSSSDIRGKEGAPAVPPFNLPPTAFQEPDQASSNSATPSANGSDSSYRPPSPKSPNDLSRKRSAATAQSNMVVTKDDFALPPPPTRSRKIIQMKPQESDGAQTPQAAPSTTQSARQSGGKRKSTSAGGTAAGRKIARKTAHSLIERRRRSKMNDEFGVMKDMIPACKGQEMHKLAILQASIEYLRYLERCVADLQAQNSSPLPQAPPPTSQGEQNDDEDDEDEDMDDDNEPEASTTPVTKSLERSGSRISLPSLSQVTSTTTESPLIFSMGAGRHYSVSSTSQASYSPYIHSNQASPAFGPQLAHISTMPSSSGPYRETFGLGSPALAPLDSAQSLRQVAEGGMQLSEKKRPNSANAAGQSEHELDREATAALLMLNSDRREWKKTEREKERSGTGMSVRDLLSG